MNNELAIELIALVKEQNMFLKEQKILVDQLIASQAVTHSILHNLPNLEVVANDYMIKMDHLATTTSPERLEEIREYYQRILFFNDRGAGTKSRGVGAEIAIII